MNKKVIIIGAGVAGPILALQLRKIGDDAEIFESRIDSNRQEGAFLGLSPNGLNVLKEFVDLNALKEDYTSASMIFFNARGKQIAKLDTQYQLQKYTVETLQLRRANLNKHIREAAADAGIKIRYGKTFISFREAEDGVTAYFADGTSVSGDLMIACDGMFSTVRNRLFADLSLLRYSKLISIGGYAWLPELAKPSESIQMTFAERVFFCLFGFR